jgi:flagella basal body P-ring formation protein FlgA
MTKLLSLFAFGSALLAASAAPLAAWAGEPVSLRADPLGHAGEITLADLFDGVSGPAAAKVVGRGAAGTQAVLDSGEVQSAAHVAGFDWSNAQGLRRIIVTMTEAPRGDGQSQARARRVAHAASQPQVLVYARSLMAGDVIAAADLQWSDEAVAGSGAPHDPDQVIGKAARSPLRAGAPVVLRDLVSPKVIHRDEMVSVDFAGEGVTLSLIGKAMGDASVGDPVEVMNTSSKKIIQAIAFAPGHASIGPAAEPARPGPNVRTASLP